MLHLNHFIDASFFMAPDGWYQVLAFHGALPNGRIFVPDEAQE